MDDFLNRFVFDEATIATINSLDAAGFFHAGTTTYRGRVMELDFFNSETVHVNISFRGMLADAQPFRKEV